MGVSLYWKVGEIAQRFLSPGGIQIAGAPVSPDHLRHLGIQKVRCVKRLVLREGARDNRIRPVETKQQLDHGRCIDYDQRVSLSALTARAADSRTLAGARSSSLALISAGVGRSATPRTSAMR